MLKITNGEVYDPLNGVDGRVQDICVSDGKIVLQTRQRQILRSWKVLGLFQSSMVMSASAEAFGPSDCSPLG